MVTHAHQGICISVIETHAQVHESHCVPVVPDPVPWLDPFATMNLQPKPREEEEEEPAKTGTAAPKTHGKRGGKR